MKIGLRGGHSPNCKGAIGILDEQQCVRELSYAIKPVLERQGHVVIDCNSDAGTEAAELSEGTDRANSNGCNLYVTLHFNAFNGTANGVEAYVHDGMSLTANAIAQRACANLSSIGLFNRGVKQSQELHDLNASNMEAVLIEVLFCDHVGDAIIWQSNGLYRIAALIANAIDPNIKVDGGVPTQPNVPVQPNIPTPPSKPVPAPSGGMDVEYAVMIEGGRILPVVKNQEDYAGIQGIPIVGIICRSSQGYISYRVHAIGTGWMGTVSGFDFADIVSGYAGDGVHHIDAVEAYLYSPDGDQYIYYRVSPVGLEYYDYQRDNEVRSGMDGYAGAIGTAIDRLQMYIA